MRPTIYKHKKHKQTMKIRMNYLCALLLAGSMTLTACGGDDGDDPKPETEQKGDDGNSNGEEEKGDDGNSGSEEGKGDNTEQKGDGKEEEQGKENAATDGWEVEGVIPAESEAVDIGLSVKWAAWNVGASSAGETGAYFAWGEVAPKRGYVWSTYKWMSDDSRSYKYITKYQKEDKNYDGVWYDSDKNFIGDGKKILDKEDDAASAAWGGNWRTPTHYEIEELGDYCKMEFKKAGEVAEGSVAGWLITGPNGNSIYLPAAAEIDGYEYYGEVGTSGSYWASDLRSTGNAYYMGFGQRDIPTTEGYGDGARRVGRTVRAVCPLD